MKKILNIIQPIKQASQLFLDKKTPFFYKLIPVGAICYILFPLDFITDFFPILGQLDDLAILTGSIGVFNSLAKKQINE